MPKEKIEKTEKKEQPKPRPVDTSKKQRETLSQQPLDYIKEKYDLDIELIEKEETRENGVVEVTPMDEEKRTETLMQIRKEIVKIPPKIFKKLNIKKIVLCGTLYHNEEQMAGLTNMGEGDVRIYIAEMFCFFHEIFHQIDYLSGGNFNSMDLFSESQLGEKARQAQKKNMDWAKLDANWTHKKSQYAKYYDEEQSDYFSYLLNLDKGQDWYKGNLVFVHRENPVNTEKEREMKKLIYQWSEGLMDYKYWIDLEAGKVDENYWE